MPNAYEIVRFAKRKPGKAGNLSKLSSLFLLELLRIDEGQDDHDDAKGDHDATNDVPEDFLEIGDAKIQRREEHKQRPNHEKANAINRRLLHDGVDAKGSQTKAKAHDDENHQADKHGEAKFLSKQSNGHGD